MCLPLEHPLLGTWPITQACALTGNQTGLQAGAQSTESHKPGHGHSFKSENNCLKAWQNVA